MPSTRFWFAATCVFTVAAFRLIPHPMNFSPVAAMALFAGSRVEDRRFAYLLPFSAMFLSDALIGFHALMPPVYVGLALTVWLGDAALRGRASWLRIGSASLTGSTAFFLITNFAVWLNGGYAPTLEGLIACYFAAIPFFRNSLAGDLFFSGALFGAWKLAEAWMPQMAPAAARAPGARD